MFTYPPPRWGGGWGLEDKFKKYFGRKCKCSDMHRKVMFGNHQPWGGGQVGINSNKLFARNSKKCHNLCRIVIFHRSLLHGVGMIGELNLQKITSFAWNLMKCIDLQRNVMFISPPLPFR